MRIKGILFVMISGITLISCGADKAGDGLNTSQKDWDVKLQVTGPRNNPEMEVISPGMEVWSCKQWLHAVSQGDW